MRQIKGPFIGDDPPHKQYHIKQIKDYTIKENKDGYHKKDK